MTDIQPILERLGLQQYHAAFVAEGFDTWESVLDIQESDLHALNVKLGHRRRLQRAIAEHRGLASDRPLASPSQEANAPETSKSEPTGTQSNQSKEPLSTAGEQKRKYRRHPKPDEHAPEKPPSAYVLFSNKIREEVKGDNLSFTEIARLVGERWQKLSASQKEMFESHAAALKDRYNAQLAEYKKTSAYQQYMEYLADFKAKHGATSKDSNEFKRPKLEPNHSSSLSAASQADSTEGYPDVPGHVRGGSIGSASTTSHHAGPASASALQLVTALPLMGEHERASSPRASRGQRVAGRFSTQSSMSEDTDTKSHDSTDALNRAAHLSLDTPGSGLSPLSTPASRMPGQELHNSTLSQHSWPLSPNQAVALQHQPLTSPSAGPTPRARHDDVSSHGHENARSQHPPHAGPLPIAQLLGPSSGASSSMVSQRILPPPRQSNDPLTMSPFGTPSVHSSHLESGSLAQSSALPFLSQHYHDRQAQARTSESEAADTLAGLAGNNQRYDPARPHGNRSQGRH